MLPEMIQEYKAELIIQLKDGVDMVITNLANGKRSAIIWSEHSANWWVHLEIDDESQSTQKNSAVEALAEACALVECERQSKVVIETF